MVSAAPAHSALVPLAAQEPVGEHSQRRLQFPAGCFVIQARTRGRKVWDIIGGGATGRVIGLHPFKEPVTRGTSLASPWNNQLFVLGWSGNLLPVCAEGKLVDCVDSTLSVAYPQGIVAVPTVGAHPPPEFAYDPTTATIRVVFSCDPSFPAADVVTDWEEYDYLVESVPQRAVERDPASAAWTATSGILGKFFGGAVEEVLAPLEEPPLVDDESDTDDQEPARALRVVRLPVSWRDDFPPECRPAAGAAVISRERGPLVRQWTRRQFTIAPVVVQPSEHGAHIITPTKPAAVSYPAAPASAGPRPLRLASSAKVASPTPPALVAPTPVPPLAASEPIGGLEVPTRPVSLTRFSSLLSVPLASLTRSRRASAPVIGLDAQLSALSLPLSRDRPLPPPPCMPLTPVLDADSEGEGDDSRAVSLEAFTPKSLGDWDDDMRDVPLDAVDLEQLMLEGEAVLEFESPEDGAAAPNLHSPPPPVGLGLVEEEATDEEGDLSGAWSERTASGGPSRVTSIVLDKPPEESGDISELRSPAVEDDHTPGDVAGL